MKNENRKPKTDNEDGGIDNMNAKTKNAKPLSGADDVNNLDYVSGTAN